MIRIYITSDALEDLNEGFLFYDMAEAGLREYFSDSLKSDIESSSFDSSDPPKSLKTFGLIH